MSFRRIPFQVSSTDPVERQRELERRFGIPSRNKMYVDSNPLTTGAGFKESTASSSSPRLQHRIPIFMDDYDQPVRSSVDSKCLTSENKKSSVRIIPIEIEGGETLPSMRHRTFSGPAGIHKEPTNEPVPERGDASPLKRSMQDLSKPTKVKATSGPKVFNIPIKVEGDCTGEKISKSDCPVGRNNQQVNGCAASKQVNEITSPEIPDNLAESKISDEQEKEINNSLKRIENVLEEFKSYESGVNEYHGTVKDKQYRYLDEMLTRCMLRLDDIDTMGNDKVRSSRKNAVKKVQACIDLLENKVNAINTVANTDVQDNDDTKEVVTDQIESTEEIENKLHAGNKHTETSKMSETEPVVSQIESTENLILSKQTHEVPEIEMVELKEPSSSEAVNSESQVNDVEMTDCFNTVHPKYSAEEAVIEENVAESMKLQVLPEAVIKGGDVEMKEMHNIADVKSNILDNEILKCSSSQPEEQNVSDANIEDKPSEVRIITNEVSQSDCTSGIDSCQNDVLNDIKDNNNVPSDRQDD